MAAVDSFYFLEKELLKSVRNIEEFLIVCGIYFVTKKTILSSIKLFNLVKNNLSIKNEKNLKLKFGEYAIITSIQNEIGKEFAISLAKKKINLIIINENHSNDFINNLKKLFNINVLIMNELAIDEMFHNKDYFSNQIMLQDIGILINCSNFYTQNIKNFLSLNNQEIDQQLFNISSSLKLNKLFLQKLVERKHGLIVNITSLDVIQDLPFITLNSVVEKLLNDFFRAIENEFQNKEIIFKTLALTNLSIQFLNEKKFNNKFINKLLPNKEKIIDNFLIQNCTHQTTGYWLFSLENYLRKNFFFNFFIKRILY